MAKMVEEVIVIKLSKLVKDSETSESLNMEAGLETIEQVVQELAGKEVLVEVEKA